MSRSSLKEHFRFKTSSRVKHSADEVDKTQKSDKHRTRAMPDGGAADTVDADPGVVEKEDAAVVGSCVTSNGLPVVRCEVDSRPNPPPPPAQQVSAQVRDRLSPRPSPSPRSIGTPNAQFRGFLPRTPPPATLIRGERGGQPKLSSRSGMSTATSATATPAMNPRRNPPIDGHQFQQRPSRYLPRPPPAAYRDVNVNSQPRQGQFRSGSFPPSFSSSSSAATGNSSSPTAQSSDTAESPPPLEPTDPSAKPPYEIVAASAKSSEEFVTPSPPYVDAGHPGLGPLYSQPQGPPRPQPAAHPGSPPPFHGPPRPLRQAPSFEGLYFAQLSLNSRPMPERVVPGPNPSKVRYPVFQAVQLECLQQHNVMHKVQNRHHCIPCMTCRTMGYRGTASTVGTDDDSVYWRYVCGCCAIRVCPGCKEELAFQDYRLSSLLRVVRERERGDNRLDLLEAPPDLNVSDQPKVSMPIGEEVALVKLPLDLEPATSAEDLLQLSTFGPPELSRGATPISRPATPAPRLALTDLPVERTSPRPQSALADVRNSQQKAEECVAEVPNNQTRSRQETPSQSPRPYSPLLKPTGANEQQTYPSGKLDYRPPKRIVAFLDQPRPESTAKPEHPRYGVFPHTPSGSQYTLKPINTQEPIFLPEFDFQLAREKPSDALTAPPVRQHEKPPVSPVRLEKESREGSIAGSIRKKLWKLPGFGKKKKKEVR